MNYWSCQYCAQGEDGWGLIGLARERVVTSMYAATDQCFALGMVRAERRGVLPEEASQCRCRDLVDNDADGLADDQDPDCDAGGELNPLP